MVNSVSYQLYRNINRGSGILGNVSAWILIQSIGPNFSVFMVGRVNFRRLRLGRMNNKIDNTEIGPTLFLSTYQKPCQQPKYLLLSGSELQNIQYIQAFHFCM